MTNLLAEALREIIEITDQWSGEVSDSINRIARLALKDEDQDWYYCPKTCCQRLRECLHPNDCCKIRDALPHERVTVYFGAIDE